MDITEGGGITPLNAGCRLKKIVFFIASESVFVSCELYTRSKWVITTPSIPWGNFDKLLVLLETTSKWESKLYSDISGFRSLFRLNFAKFSSLFSPKVVLIFFAWWFIIIFLFTFSSSLSSWPVGPPFDYLFDSKSLV